jgi:hypothetical protein
MMVAVTVWEEEAQVVKEVMAAREEVRVEQGARAVVKVVVGRVVQAGE